MSERTDYEIELSAIEREISGLEAAALARPLDAEKATRLVYRLFHRATLSGDVAGLAAVEAAIDEVVGRLGSAPDLYLLKANLDFRLHRLAETKRDLASAPGLRESFEGRAMEADIAFQEGRYEAARTAYEGLIAENRTWDTLARLAHLEARMGEPAADQRYADAQEELTAKEMRSFAWVELQRGLLDLAHGRFPEAAAHCARAGRAYSGYWLVDEHAAGLLGAQGRFDEAAALLARVVERAPKPELQQVLGELYACMGRPELGEPCHERALRTYLASVERGDVHYYHHLVDFYAHVRGDGGAALRWARRDLALRENFSTQAALAWALYLDGQVEAARDMIERALSSGVRESEYFHQAGMICRAAGAPADAERYLQLAAGVDPHFDRFHMHH